MSPKETPKKERLLAAAKAVMAQRGFANTTVSLVAEQAGVSRGLIHYHFSNKEEMLVQVLRTTMEEALENFRQETASATCVETLAHCVAARYRLLFTEDPAFFRLFLEGLVAAQFSDRVRQEIMSQYEAFGLSLTVNLQRIQGTADDCVSIGAMSPATLVTALLDGFGSLLVAAPQVAEQEDAWVCLESGILKLIS